MTIVEELADAALARDALRVRSIAQQLGRSGQSFESLPRPLGNAVRQIVSAALLDLIAVRKSLVSPSWTQDVGQLSEPFHLLAAADRMPRLRAQCERDSPLPLRLRNLFAPAEFLDEV